jgi:hypothetical protein
MIRRTGRADGPRERRWLPTPSVVLAGMALFIVLGGTAFAAKGLIHAGDIATGAVTGRAIRDGAVEPKNLSTNTRALFGSAAGVSGPKGDDGSTGPAGATGAVGSTA